MAYVYGMYGIRLWDVWHTFMGCIGVYGIRLWDD
jgi:hypothetical protein